MGVGVRATRSSEASTRGSRARRGLGDVDRIAARYAVSYEPEPLAATGYVPRRLPAAAPHRRERPGRSAAPSRSTRRLCLPNGSRRSVATRGGRSFARRPPGDIGNSSLVLSEPFPSNAVAILVGMIDSRLDARTIGFPAPRGAEAHELEPAAQPAARARDEGGRARASAALAPTRTPPRRAARSNSLSVALSPARR